MEERSCFLKKKKKHSAIILNSENCQFALNEKKLPKTFLLAENKVILE